MNRFYRLIDDISDFLVSLAFLVPVFFGFMAYRYYEIFMLFSAELQLSYSYSTLGALLIASVGIFTTLIFMVHGAKLAPIVIRRDSPLQGGGHRPAGVWHWSKLVLVIYAFVINAFFWKPWESPTVAGRIFRWFCCVMFSSMDYGFVHLFNALHGERTQQHHLSTLEQDISKAEQELSELRAAAGNELAQSQRLKAFIQEHTCTHCGEIFPSPRSKRAHESQCKNLKP